MARMKAPSKSQRSGPLLLVRPGNKFFMILKILVKGGAGYLDSCICTARAGGAYTRHTRQSERWPLLHGAIGAAGHGRYRRQCPGIAHIKEFGIQASFISQPALIVDPKTGQPPWVRTAWQWHQTRFLESTRGKKV